MLHRVHCEPYYVHGNGRGESVLIVYRSSYLTLFLYMLQNSPSPFEEEEEGFTPIEPAPTTSTGIRVVVSIFFILYGRYYRLFSSNFLSSIVTRFYNSF